MSGTRLYVGNLPPDVTREEVERLFDSFGPIRALDIKHGHEPNAPSFAFLEYTDPRDAEDAMRKRDGSDMGGLRLRVEPAKGGHVSTSSRGPPRRGQFRVRVTGLPVSASWQDLKDHMRSVGDVGYADVKREGPDVVGYVEYGNRADMDSALEKLDRSTFKNRFNDASEIRVGEDTTAGGDGGGASYGGGGGRGGYGGGRDDYRGGYGGGGGYGRDDYRGGGYGGGRDDYRGGGEYRSQPPPRDDYRGGGYGGRDDYRGGGGRDDYRGGGGRDDYRGGYGGGGGYGRDDYRGSGGGYGGGGYAPPPRDDRYQGGAAAAADYAAPVDERAAVSAPASYRGRSRSRSRSRGEHR